MQLLIPVDLVLCWPNIWAEAGTNHCLDPNSFGIISIRIWKDLSKKTDMLHNLWQNMFAYLSSDE